MTAGRQVISQVKEWNTPPEYVEVIRKFFGTIHLDPCANEHSFVHAEYEYQLPVDGLIESWDYPTIYVNPPYGRDKARKTTIKHWLQKCAEANRFHRSQVIALIPVATNTKHWQDNIFLTSTSICFLRVPRLKFYMGGSVIEKGAPMSCALVYWGTKQSKFEQFFSSFGKIMHLLL